MLLFSVLFPLTLTFTLVRIVDVDVDVDIIPATSLFHPFFFSVFPSRAFFFFPDSGLGEGDTMVWLLEFLFFFASGIFLGFEDLHCFGFALGLHFAW